MKILTDRRRDIILKWNMFPAIFVKGKAGYIYAAHHRRAFRRRNHKRNAVTTGVQQMIRKLTESDIEAWLQLAAEVEHLFGDMVGDEGFHGAMEECIRNGNALCVDEDTSGPAGIIAFDPGGNEILWFAVGAELRGKGFGKQLLESALSELDATKPVFVQTFSPGIAEGHAARALYIQSGFADHREGGLNPAGLDTVIMIKE